MNYQEYIRTLKDQVDLQPYEQGLRFSVLVCQKLYPEYRKFNEVYKWGDPDLLEEAITICQNATGHLADLKEVEEMLPRVDKIAPHMDDFGSELGSYALNASAAVYETLQFIAEKNKTHIYNIATYYTDTIDFKIQEERTLTEQEIERHPLMIEAWNFVLDHTQKGF